LGRHSGGGSTKKLVSNSKSQKRAMRRAGQELSGSAFGCLAAIAIKRERRRRPEDNARHAEQPAVFKQEIQQPFSHGFLAVHANPGLLRPSLLPLSIAKPVSAFDNRDSRLYGALS
jgi:hypothetical protein